jgi:hypothetical protein
MTPRVKEILSWYGADSPGTLTSLARLLNRGRLAGTGKLVILPVDHGLRIRAQRTLGISLFVFAWGVLPEGAWADRFVNVHYDAVQDQLVVALAYRGTNPDHTFSLQWGPCKTLAKGGYQIEATVLDSQWQDAAKRDFTKTTRFSLAGLRCRPAELTVRTAPRFFYTLQVPARKP